MDVYVVLEIISCFKSVEYFTFMSKQTSVEAVINGTVYTELCTPDGGRG